MAPASRVQRAVVVAPAFAGAGGLGRSSQDILHGFQHNGIPAAFVGTQPALPLQRAAASKIGRRIAPFAGVMLQTERVRRAVPRDGWQLAFAICGVAPPPRADRVVCIHQATCHPDVERARVAESERATGGTGDYFEPQRRQRLAEIERVDLIRVTTETVRQQFLQRGVPAEKLLHLYPGVDLERYRPGPKGDGPIRVAFVGPLSLRKGIDVVDELNRRLPDGVVLEAVGGPSDPWSRRVAARAGLTISDSVPELLARAHVFILPSRSDAFAYTVLEAMACGAVPIVSDRVGAGELAAQLDPRLVIDFERFADGFLELLPQLDLPTLSQRGRELAAGFERVGRARENAAAIAAAADRILAARA